ncbi:unnamed protein product [Laminaria digitata]
MVTPREQQGNHLGNSRATIALMYNNSSTPELIVIIMLAIRQCAAWSYWSLSCDHVTTCYISFFSFFFFLFSSTLLSSHFCLSPSVVATQIQGHKAGTSPPSPHYSTYMPSFLSRKKRVHSALFPTLVDFHRILRTPGR